MTTRCGKLWPGRHSTADHEVRPTGRGVGLAALLTLAACNPALADVSYWLPGEFGKAIGTDPSRPQFKGMVVLCHGVNVERGRGSFDLIVRLSTTSPDTFYLGSVQALLGNIDQCQIEFRLYYFTIDRRRTRLN
jgi:hypothetical protein